MPYDTVETRGLYLFQLLGVSDSNETYDIIISSGGNALNV